MRARRVRILSAGGAFALCAAVTVVGLGAAPTAYAAEKAYSCSDVPTQPEPGSSAATGSALDPVPPDPFADQLQMKAAQAAAGNKPGSGVTVAVIDSGIDFRPIAKSAGLPQQNSPDLYYYHGTTVASIIAGSPEPGGMGGIAPYAHLVDYNVWDKPAEGDGGTGKVDLGKIETALAALAGRPGKLNGLIVNMSLAIDADDPTVRSQISQLTQRGAIVVAAGGNRQDSENPSASPPPYTGTEDHGKGKEKDVYPADYDLPTVVAVGASNTPGTGAIGDPTESVFANSQIDVSAPTAGIRAWTLTVKPCVIADVATSWSTAEVSGVLALLWSKYRGASATQIVQQLERTASGRDDERGVFAGAGVVQPLDALTRPLGAPSRVQTPAARQVKVPPPRDDVLAGTRHDTMWWGLIGGGALILALILRPLFSRRRG